MNTSVGAFDHPHPMGDPATHSIAGLPSRLAALHPQGVRRIRKPPKAATTPLLLLAGPAPPRTRKGQALTLTHIFPSRKPIHWSTSPISDGGVSRKAGVVELVAGLP